MDKTIRHEMAITRKEFFRLLPAAVQDRNYRITDNVIDIRDGAGTITIELETESRRTIASLSLPVTKLSIRFTDFDDRDIKDFIKRFDLAYQKGGG